MAGSGPGVAQSKATKWTLLLTMTNRQSDTSSIEFFFLFFFFSPKVLSLIFENFKAEIKNIDKRNNRRIVLDDQDIPVIPIFLKARLW